MPATVNEQTVDAVNIDNVKTVAGTGSWAVAQRQMDYVSHAKRLDIIAEKSLQRFVDSDVIVDKLSQLDAGQVGAKVANTTPPETGVAQGLATLNAAVATILAQLEVLRPKA